MVAKSAKNVTASHDYAHEMERKTGLHQYNTVDFNTAITLCGSGKFHTQFIIVCSAIFLFGGCQAGINSYIIPAAECDLNLNSYQKGLINVALLTGGAVGIFTWGIISDAFGRKKIIIGALFTDNTLTLLSSFSQSFETLVLGRALAGFFNGAPTAVLYSYLGEFYSANYRARSVCLAGCFWKASMILLPALGWFVIPLRFTIEYQGYIYNSWRLYLALIGLPNLIFGCILSTYPESPKYLLACGRKQESLDILKKIYATNTGKSEAEYPVKELEDLNDGLAAKLSNVDDLDKSTKASVIKHLFQNIRNQLSILSTPPLLIYIVLCSTIYCLNTYGFYGLGIWMPELFHRFNHFYENNPNVSTARVCELVESNTTSTVRLLDCVNHTINKGVFIDNLIINTICLVSNIISSYLLNYVGRRTIPVTTSLLAGLSGFAIYFVESSTQILVVATIFTTAISTATIVLNSVVVDIFPIQVSALTVCITTFFGRIGAISSNIAFGLLIDAGCEVLIFLVSSIIVASGILCFFLPSRKT